MLGCDCDFVWLFECWICECYENILFGMFVSDFEVQKNGIKVIFEGGGEEVLKIGFFD